MPKLKRKNAASTVEARQPDGAAAKALPATRGRHVLTDDQVEELVNIAHEAAEIRRLPSRKERGKRFHDLAEARKIRHETLLKWGFLSLKLKKRLGPLLHKLGKTKLYILSYVKDPAAVLRDGVQDRHQPGKMLDVRVLSAEELRRHISAQQDEPERRNRHWFRINREQTKRDQVRAVAEALSRTTNWLEEDVARVVHRINEGVSRIERKKIRGFRAKLRELASSITTALRTPRRRKQSAPRKLV